MKRLLTRSTIIVSIAMIITLAVVVLRPSTAFAFCPSSFIRVMDALSQATSQGANPEEMKSILSMLREYVTECEGEEGGYIYDDNDGSIPPIDKNNIEVALSEAFSTIAENNCRHVYPNHPDQLSRGVVTRQNYTCIDQYDEVSEVPNVADTFQEFAEVWSEEWQYLQCTNCVFGFTKALGKPFRTNGNAKEWVSREIPGYTWVPYAHGTGLNISKLRPGSVFVKTAGTYGHVGIIIGYEKGSDTFLAFHCNSPTDGKVSFRQYPLEFIVGWYVPNN